MNTNPQHDTHAPTLIRPVEFLIKDVPWMTVQFEWSSSTSFTAPSLSHCVWYTVT